MYKVSLVSEGLIDFIRHFQSKKYSKQSFSIDPSEILGRLHQNALIKMEKSAAHKARAPGISNSSPCSQRAIFTAPETIIPTAAQARAKPTNKVARASMWAYGMDMSELEPAQYRLLSVARCRTHEGMDNLPTGRCSFGTTSI